MAGKLIMIGMPIGNPADISPRARDTLEMLDVLYCEDTRVTGRLLAFLGISVKTISLHDDSPEKQWQKAIQDAVNGKTIGFAADAGMPGISDPGRKLVRLAWDAHVALSVVPGPSSVGSLLACCPFVSKRFTFHGFAPRSKSDLSRFAKDISISADPVFFFDSPRRVYKTLAVLATELDPDREILVGREMTKFHEQLLLFRIGDWSEIPADLPELGEFTIAVSGCVTVAPEDPMELKDCLGKLKQAGFSNRDAVLALATVRNLPLNKIKPLVYGE